ncbi:hypothetical protein LFM09_45810, partial [Lentzea alba]
GKSDVIDAINAARTALSGDGTATPKTAAGPVESIRVLHVAVVVRLRYCPRTQTYLQRRTEQGLTKRDIIRCLKHYVLREAHTAILKDLTHCA